MNKIHPTVIIGKDVILGDGNEILPYTTYRRAGYYLAMIV